MIWASVLEVYNFCLFEKSCRLHDYEGLLGYRIFFVCFKMIYIFEFKKSFLLNYSIIAKELNWTWLEIFIDRKSVWSCRRRGSSWAWKVNIRFPSCKSCSVVGDLKSGTKQESILPSFHFSSFPIFAVKLESLLWMKKTEKFFVSEEKMFGRIDSRTVFFQRRKRGPNPREELIKSCCCCIFLLSIWGIFRNCTRCHMLLCASSVFVLCVSWLVKLPPELLLWLALRPF